MRARGTDQGLTALAVAGSWVVVLGWDMAEQDMRARGVLGFGVQRTRPADGEIIWLGGMKTFRSVDPNPGPGVLVSSRYHPLQTFQWSDYTAEPGKDYEYRVVAMTGAPDALREDASVRLSVTTESVDLGRHAIFFNRGAIASQEYARRFQNRMPSEVGAPAYEWLSRGLIEGLEGFIGLAGAGDALEGAFFEFRNRRIHVALREARRRGTRVRILYDGDSQRENNEEALEGSGITGLVNARERSGRYMHNKFIVLSRGGQPAEVWTGSTNLSENGIFGHSNNAHLLRDYEVARAYRDYWAILDKDPPLSRTAAASTSLSPAPVPPGAGDTIAVFSPRTDLAALDWYAQLAGGAQRALFMTFAFGMNDRFVPVYDQADDVLRFALMEKKGNGRTFRRQAEEVDRIRKHANTVVAVGNRVQLNAFDRWLEETDRAVAEAHVLYVHTKYMLIDPLGPDPTVVVGSANFSKASTDTNDENMLVIRGNEAVADIYLGEFMRLFTHYAFRESLGFRRSGVGRSGGGWLIEDVDWVNAGYFVAGDARALRRSYFAGN